ncbi:ribonuclease T2 family protein [Rhodobacter capsulatus]|uniref:ribonuclease T2 family protein n=1 Tax=Rhodobacter capsulatus TaxID=1061 RepID=UPI0003D37961|nr:ribonuclease T2 [Rhodobacter capsulatus]ETD83278.1 ribonuclease T2 [Rhodobacter capsulatus B6]
MRVFAICAACLLAFPAFAGGERAGRFDYYLLALSWSPGWCATEGRDRAARQCDPGSGADFVLHGLWPQFEAGWPRDCRSSLRDPSRAETAAMADVMGSDGAAWHQWKKHGRCSGLSAAEYFATARQAYASVAIPVAFQQLAQDVRLPAAAVEQAFLTANPRLSPEMVTVTCTGERIDDVRICLTKDLEPRPCGADVRRECRKQDALMERVR